MTVKNRNVARKMRPAKKKAGLSVQVLRLMIESKIDDERDPQQKKKLGELLREFEGGSNGR